MLTVEGGDAEMTQQKNSRKGSAVWPMVLSWLSSLILALLAVFVMLFTTFGNVGYMQSCVKSSGYARAPMMIWYRILSVMVQPPVLMPML